jgi:hypothetical protein
MSRTDFSRIEIATAEGATAMLAGVDALNDSTIPFCGADGQRLTGTHSGVGDGNVSVRSRGG